MKLNHKQTFRLLVFSLCLNIAAVGIFTGRRIYYHYTAAEHTIQENAAIRQAHYDKMCEAFAYFPNDPNAIVFLGNSLTEAFPVYEFFGKYNVKNRGIFGDHIQGVIQRISPITAMKPRKIFIEIGTNDITETGDLTPIMSSYITLLETIKRQSPLTKIYVQSLLPTSLEYRNRLEKIIAFNQLLKAYCIAKHIVYIDLFPSFNQSGLNKAYTTDGLHLNIEGYIVWKNKIERYVAE